MRSRRGRWTIRKACGGWRRPRRRAARRWRACRWALRQQGRDRRSGAVPVLGCRGVHHRRDLCVRRRAVFVGLAQLPGSGGRRDAMIYMGLELARRLEVAEALNGVACAEAHQQLNPGLRFALSTATHCRDGTTPSHRICKVIFESSLSHPRRDAPSEHFQGETLGLSLDPSGWSKCQKWSSLRFPFLTLACGATPRTVSDFHMKYK